MPSPQQVRPAMRRTACRTLTLKTIAVIVTGNLVWARRIS
jgi:hypothetical protein